MLPASSPAAHTAVELELANATVGDRELLAQQAELLAEALIVLERSAKSRADPVIAAAGSGWEARHSLPVAAQSLDLLTQLGLGVEELPADASRGRNGREADGDPGLLEGPEGLASTCLGIPRSRNRGRPDCVTSLIAHGSRSARSRRSGSCVGSSVR